MATNRPSLDSDKFLEGEQRLHCDLSLVNNALQPEASANWLEVMFSPMTQE